MSSQANIFHFSSHHLHLSYSTGALGSKAGLTYQDAHQTKQFNDQDIRRVSTDLGEEVTVTINLTVDVGSTTFTLIVPRVALELNQHVHVETLGITALHRFPLVPIKHGQLDSYSVVKLRGTASSQTF
jgi:hypothetical protein